MSGCADHDEGPDHSYPHEADDQYVVGLGLSYE